MAILKKLWLLLSLSIVASAVEPAAKTSDTKDTLVLFDNDISVADKNAKAGGQPTEVVIAEARVNLADRDGPGGSGTKLDFPNKLTQLLEADSHQRLVVEFQLKDRTSGHLMTAHQTFVLLRNTETKQEIVFVAEPDSKLTYKLDIDLQTKSKELSDLSGLYEMTLIVGDVLISNPIQWRFADIRLQLSSGSSVPKPVSPFDPKDPIDHMFRKQEKRPPLLLSNLFSVLVSLPLLVMIGLWIKLGVNASGFSLSLSSLMFHSGLALIFGLYVCFFIKLNMFDTCKYLSVLAVITFLSGQQLLSRLSKSKSN